MRMYYCNHKTKFLSGDKVKLGTELRCECKYSKYRQRVSKWHMETQSEIFKLYGGLNSYQIFSYVCTIATTKQSSYLEREKVLNWDVSVITLNIHRELQSNIRRTKVRFLSYMENSTLIEYCNHKTKFLSGEWVLN